jgi:aminoglycoside phosphotransferase (APT) family kinase protein
VIPGTEREIAKLPLVAPLLPVAVPDPIYVGTPNDEYPWPFYGAPYIAGAEPDGSMGDGVRGGLARPLARFLRALHSEATLATAGDGLPVDPMGRADMEVRVPRAREEIGAIADLWHPPDETEELLDEASALPKPAPSALCHGDLHFRQLLVEGSVLTGVIDWVDICLGDPAMDLALVYGLLPRDARDAFFAEYGEVDHASGLRARVLALNLMAVLARYGRDEGLPGVEAEARAGLDRVFA